MTLNEMDPRIRWDDKTLVIHGIDENSVIPAQAGIHLNFLQYATRVAY
jgi:hypothetical protein